MALNVESQNPWSDYVIFIKILNYDKSKKCVSLLYQPESKYVTKYGLYMKCM